MAIKQMLILPIYWGEWWNPSKGNAYSWVDLNGLLQAVVSGRYMDGLNQYGIGRGFVSGLYVYPVDPPSTGFTDSMRDAMFRNAINDGHVSRPDEFDLNTQLPFYCLMVKPGVEHLIGPNLTPDSRTGAYHYPFLANYWDGGTWKNGQVCWVKGDSTKSVTVQRLVHEMAEAYSGSEIADKCLSATPVVVNSVLVPQYWSANNASCWPPADPPPIIQQGPQVSLYAVGTDGGVWSAWWTRTEGWHDDPWLKIGTGIFAQNTPVAVVSQDPDSVSLYAVGTDGGVWSAWWTRTEGWHDDPWLKIGTGIFAQNTPVAVVSQDPDNVSLYAVGTKGGVWSAWWTRTGGWHDWTRIGTGFFAQNTPVAVVSQDPDSVSLYAVGTDGGVWSAWWTRTGGWHDWTRIGTGIFAQNTPIAVVSQDPDNVSLYAVGTKGGVWSAWWTRTGGWHDWTRIGTGFFAQNTPVAVVSQDPDSVSLYAVGTDGGVWSAWWTRTGGWHDDPWLKIGTGIFAQNTPVAVVSQDPDNVSLYAVGTKGGVWSAWWTRTGGWHDWTRIGTGFFAQNTPVAVVSQGLNT